MKLILNLSSPMLLHLKSNKTFFSVNILKVSGLILFVSYLIAMQGCVTNPLTAERIILENQLAQKIMLDLRFYCPDISAAEAEVDGFQCKQPMTKLPKELAQLITDTSLGSIILFAQNIESVAQTVTLTRDLQNAALKSRVAQPLLISTDQEGGRVVRIPRDISTSFTGNMSIGATYARQGDKYAREVGKVLGAELKALGINVNHGPDVDVNVNLDNPVINVRSFSENPQIVADLGIAMLEGIESMGVIATLKHFPGHGDTNVDSHTGLPTVLHNLSLAKRVDLYPFSQALKKTDVKMIMTAHIQYPALDSSEVVNKFGQSMIKPATLSKKILTKLLREEMGFQGLIITDALDMAGISRFFTPIEAVLATFDAGADIAMMPMKIRTKEDINRFKIFIKDLADRVEEQQSMADEIALSVARITKAKQALVSDIVSDEQLVVNISKAKQILGNEQHKAIEMSLAQHAIVEISKTKNVINLKGSNKVHVVFPKPEQSKAMVSYLAQASEVEGSVAKQITYSSLLHYDERTLFSQLNHSDVVIVACDSQKTAVELGGFEDLAHGNIKVEQGPNDSAKALKILKYAKKHGITTVFVSLKLPTKLAEYSQYSDWLLATFDGNTYYDEQTAKFVAPSLAALTDILFAKQQAKGVLPITLK
ncbi:MAG: glycosyl hydrolase family 3 [Colwellia sp.]|nr:glycosyl hydrolase family 3 [Colwellia sp.]